MIDAAKTLDSKLAMMPIIAILRGLEPTNAEAVGETLYEAGIRVIEVPLNSPNPLRSIETLAKIFDDQAIIGAGTVTSPSHVQSVHDAGGQLVVSPNTNHSVIKKTVALKMFSCPGCLTPSDCYDALDAGAHALKIFPANIIGPNGIKAIRTILPSETRILAVGGVSDSTMSDYAAVGVRGFGLGSSLFKPDMTLDEIQSRVKSAVTAARAV